ncbi:MAG: hypothetical protein LBE59_00990 [Nevskiaceae bacterium]|jgi:hypothetical protein|nr:hypothetical protein [Nevskiaceae bacterium]
MIRADVMADIAINIIGAFGVGACIWHLLRTPGRSPLENRLLFLLWTLMMLMTLRTFFWTGAAPALRGWVLAVATLLPLAALFTIEGLLRRHAPRLVKIGVVLAVAALLGINATIGLHGAGLIALMAVMAGTFLVCAILVIGRDRNSLSAAENRLISGFGVACVLAVPLAITDFRRDFVDFPVRAGAVGALLIVYSLVRDNRRGKSWAGFVRELGQLLLRGLPLALLLAVFVREGDALQRALVITIATLAVVMQIVIFDRIRNRARQMRSDQLRRWLLDAPTASRNEFIASLDRLPELAGLQVMQPSALGKYDVDVLRSFLERQRVVGLTRLQQHFGNDDAAQQLCDLLHIHGMTHVCLLAAQPLTILLCALPEVQQTGFGEPELQLIQRFAQLTLERLPA